MLNSIYINNFALFNEVSIDFEKGLNIISGETGSGKSILLNALSLLTGARINKSFLGKFGNFSRVEAQFTVNERVKKILEANEISCDDEIIISRKFSDNSSVIKVNNRPITLSVLSAISDNLFDIHGQHSQLVILNKSNYLEIIDAFNNETNILKSKISQNLKRIKDLNKDLLNIDIDPDELAREVDILKFQINEIIDFDFSNFNEKDLSMEHKKLSNLTEIINSFELIKGILDEGYSRKSLKDYVNEIYSKLTDISEFDKTVDSFVNTIADVREIINDFSREVESYIYSISIDEERLSLIEDLFTRYHNLTRKYGRDESEILDFLNKSENRLNILENIDQNREEIKAEVSNLEENNIKLATKLSSLRKNIINELEQQIVRELEEMNMKNLQFKISIESTNTVRETGFDQIDFMISTNKGQDLKSLSQVGSGGEISRFMLALKAVLAKHEKVSTILFDEIDTGISGKTADIVGNKLKKISKDRQLIVITHLPQIASKADSHYLIEKESDQFNTISSIRKLGMDDKVKEVARLISGSNLTESSLLSANELIRENTKDNHEQ